MSVMQNIRHTKAFTLVELLVGLLITSIILAAVATLAFVFNSANTASGDTAYKQAQLRHATLHISELIRNAKLICAAPGNDLVVWAADENADDQINLNEIVYIERGTDLDTLRLCRFSSAGNPQTTIADLAQSTTKSTAIFNYNETYIPLIPECGNVQFGLDRAPPLTGLVAVSFDLTENNVARRYEISTALRAWAGHLLSDANDIVASDDD
jgi:prepilin-type N-terminal cleavage/methylation domain-containing protein